MHAARNVGGGGGGGGGGGASNNSDDSEGDNGDGKVAPATEDFGYEVVYELERMVPPERLLFFFSAEVGK